MIFYRYTGEHSLTSAPVTLDEIKDQLHLNGEALTQLSFLDKGDSIKIRTHDGDFTVIRVM